MKIPFWKKAFSYISDVHLESLGSDLNPELHVSLVKGRLQLTTHNSIYSFADKYDHFSKTFGKVNWNNLDSNDVLLLGLGLASIPFMLEKKFKKIFNYTAIEIDHTVAHLSNKYVTSSLKSPFETIITDAEIYMQQCVTKYDLICVDLYVDDVIPYKFKTMEFLNSLKDSLNENGILIYNSLAQTDSDYSESITFYQNKFHSVFPQACHLEIEGNLMLISNKKWLM